MGLAHLFDVLDNMTTTACLGTIMHSHSEEGTTKKRGIFAQAREMLLGRPETAAAERGSSAQFSTGSLDAFREAAEAMRKSEQAQAAMRRVSNGPRDRACSGSLAARQGAER
jgi:hypothetical protein